MTNFRVHIISYVCEKYKEFISENLCVIYICVLCNLSYEYFVIYDFMTKLG